MQTVDDKGVINILAADKLMNAPRLYATFLLWMLSELFETLPEVGDLDKPKLVFFFDEAHLLFKDAPTALVERIELVVRLVRSKGVGVYFVTQNPLDVPDTVLGQLGNRVQHALRAFTPRDQRAIKAAAETFRINPKLDVEAAITELKVGEALVSTLGDDGAPSVVQRTLVAPPRSRLGPIPDKERAIVQSISPFDGKYDTRVDRESAEEVLAAKAADAAATAQEVEEKGREEVAKQERKSPGLWDGIGGKVAGLLAWRGGRWDAMVGAAYEKRGTFYDGHGNRVGTGCFGLRTLIVDDRAIQRITFDFFPDPIHDRDRLNRELTSR
jgi:DNA helicase HerA-like ATPase